MSGSSPVPVADSLAGLGWGGRPVHLAIGMFDGVHRGHRALLRDTVATARADGAEAVVLTFEPHPSRVLRPAAAVPQMLDAAEKVRRLSQTGISAIVRLPFTLDLAAQEPAEFPSWLRAALPGLRCLHVGENFRYGHDRAGDVQRLRKDAGALGVRVVALPRVEDPAGPISSTRVRTLIAAGDLSAAAELLGEPHGGQARVVSGRALGRTIGFPTANLDWSPELRPPAGVYAVRFALGGNADRILPAVANYGLRPTVGEQTVPILELHALQPIDVAPGDTLGFHLLAFLRPERRFPHLDALRDQIAADTAAARRLLGVSS